MTHTLKIWPGSYEAVVSGEQKHDIRNTADRKFNVGDDLILREWKPEVTESGPTGEGVYTGRQLLRKISCVSVPGSWGLLPQDVCVFSFK